MALLSVVVGWFLPPVLCALILCPLIYWLLRRRCLRRLSIMQRAFPTEGEKILERHVAYFRSLSDPEKARFRQLWKIFLNEIRIIGIRTEVDDTVRLLVAASAIIPIFGLHDWEYHRLGEVLIYPESLSEKYQTTGNAYENILGMVGLKHLSGVMILSKLSPLAGFDNAISSNNLGVPEFARLISHEEVEHGLPLEVPWQSIKRWAQYVAEALSHPAKNHPYINDYAYTNEREYLAVLAEYFFKSPEICRKKIQNCTACFGKYSIRIPAQR
ncbi:zinc-dependent peptidase [Telmatocola sphagniphila]|nr:zinc-dependent peptidase [Telmatocola sphagniphila]